ncbi:hypothetical protein GCM10007890_01010 [Methylobacterium tardum]|uniref:Uncharacterized protein n=1 Tax=Methylobacterium tardum TaxID=374432 RepID=A0AA37T7F5_9HYPH|nr:hypothetical protein GCM10007890_01010 [Methylobacterium tardum]
MAEYERVSGELTKLCLAEQSLASIGEGAPLDEPANNQAKRHRASAEDGHPRATRGVRGPRANSAKGRLRTLLEESGSQGLTHPQIAERLVDVATNTLATYLSVMANSGELKRDGDRYRTGAPAAAASDKDAATDDHEASDKAEAAEQAHSPPTLKPSWSCAWSLPLLHFEAAVDGAGLAWITGGVGFSPAS